MTEGNERDMKMKAGLGYAAGVYWSNKDTGLVSDIPHEARMYPAKMGTLTLK